MPGKLFKSASFFRREKKKPYAVKIDNFGNAKNNLKLVLDAGKNRLFDGLIQSDIAYLQAVREALFNEAPGSKTYLPTSVSAKRNEAVSLFDLLTKYRESILDARRNAEAKFPLALKHNSYMFDGDIKKHTDQQIEAINKLVTKPTTAYEKEKSYDLSIAALKLILSVDFLEILKDTLPVEIELAPRATRKHIDGNKIAPSMIDTTSEPQHDKYSNDMQSEAMIFPSDNATQPEIVSRLAKQSAKRTTTQMSMDLNDKDFLVKATSSLVLNSIAESIKRLSNLTTDVTAASQVKTSQYITDPSLKKIHDATKKKLYEKKFITRQTGDAIAVMDTSNNVFLNIALRNSQESKVEFAVLTVRAEVSDRFDTQALVVDELRQLALTLNAISVKISSVVAGTKVNIDNVLKAAFNALHADLVPKFDDATKSAIKAFAVNAKMHNGDDPNEANAYTSRYQSKQFAYFLVSIMDRKQSNNILVHKEFTQLQSSLKYDKAYTINRHKKGL